jgi:hypothetical protein
MNSNCLQNSINKKNRSIFLSCIKSLVLIFPILITACSAGPSYKKAESYISETANPKYFTLAKNGTSVPILASSEDLPGVLRVVNHLQTDITNVTGTKPKILYELTRETKNAVIIGTIGMSPIIDKLIQLKKIDVSDIQEKWETFLIQVVDQPLPGINKALVITGSDKRGTIYGIFDLSEHIGVSPWYWWSDVPVKKKKEIYIKPVRYTLGEPAVKYRGIFLNDEAPALTGWVRENFGDYNSKFYIHVFELILRLKGNFLWPAMWNNAFADDDPQNMILADEYGIVMSTSHHEPMMRADKEWNRYGKGPWEYSTNSENLYKFWVEGAERYKDYECVFTLGMRGQQDRPMSEGENIELLERIVQDQREILSSVFNDRDITEVPQVWCLYKEVQAYYEKGMRVPDDVTLLWSDDNWGNIRRLPLPGERDRLGRAGVYYHFDYVGGPRNYKWLNTNPIARVWEQMHLAYQYGADRIWIVNVGDLKPMEFSINFFLKYAWDPNAIQASDLPEYTRLWVVEQFGENNSEEIAGIITRYLKFNSRRKPELLSPETYSLINYREAETVVKKYNELANKAKTIYNSLPDEYKDAFYELVLHPVEACANLNDLYVTAGMNRLYAKQGRAVTNTLAERAEVLFNKDAEITKYYHTELAGGKWNHMMSQTHIGYTYWQQPDQNNMPEVEKISLSDRAEMGIAIEGSDKWWPEEKTQAQLPEFDPYNDQKFYMEIFNRGKKPFDFTVKPGEDWINISEKRDTIETEMRIWVSIDWNKAPKGYIQAPITIKGSEGSDVKVMTSINNPEKTLKGFVESNGYISIEAEHFTKKVKTDNIDWLIIPDFGRTLSGITPVPVTSVEQIPEGNSPHLEYKVYLFKEGEVNVNAYLAPTMNFNSKPEGIRFAISFDDEKPQIINMTSNPNPADLNYDPVWNRWVSANINIQVSKHKIEKSGEHILKFWMVDPGVVLQKLVIETGNIGASYLGPPESAMAK